MAEPLEPTETIVAVPPALAPPSLPHWPPGGEVCRLPATASFPEIVLSSYLDETQLDALRALISKDLSEPYSIFTYRRFLHGWPEFTLLAHAGGALVGAIVCKSEVRERSRRVRGYVAMLAVEAAYRRCGVGRRLAVEAFNRMAVTCQELSMETEATNTPAIKLYESLGFVKDKRLIRYYLNGGDAWRLKVVLR
jgi:peptide alpha-N-acetyltransferase